MSNLDLQKLVHEYSVGFIPRDLYLLRRREVIDKAVDFSAAPAKNIENRQQDDEAESPHLNQVQINKKSPAPIIAIAAVVIVAVAGILFATLFGGNDEQTDPLLQGSISPRATETSQNQLVMTLLDQLTGAEDWQPLQLRELNSQWNELPKEQQSDIQLSREWQLFVDQTLDRLPVLQRESMSGNTTAAEKINELNNLARSANLDFDALAEESNVLLAQAQQDKSANPGLKANSSGAESSQQTQDQIEPNNSQSVNSSGNESSQQVAESTEADSGSAGSEVSEIDWNEKSNVMMNNFKVAMEKGDVNKIVNMFASNGSYLSVESRSSIKRTLDKMVANTQNRKVELQVDSWTRKNDFITGVGRYKLQSDHQNLSEQRIITSDLKVVLAANQNKLKIAAFDVFNKDIISNPLSAENESVTNVELKRVMNKFVKAYEKGDIDSLLNLFSDNAKTNDQQGKDGVKNDYSVLFNTTSNRHMYVKDLQWKIQRHIGKGQSKFVILVTPTESGVEQSFKGNFDITVEKTEKGPLITHFFHNVE